MNQSKPTSNDFANSAFPKSEKIESGRFGLNNNVEPSIMPMIEVRSEVDQDRWRTDWNNPGTGMPGENANKHKKGTGNSAPYIPSYMDLSNGPEPCVVCGDAATGYHYRCMTCEGCKGFFRRTIQKDLKYHCKWNGQCVIDKNTRNQCQQCRYKKCINVGMAIDLVLNERQRKAKRKLIEENRERRKREEQTPIQPQTINDLSNTTLLQDVDPLMNQRMKSGMTAPDKPKHPLSEPDLTLISNIVAAFEKTTTKLSDLNSPLPMDPEENSNRMLQQIAEVIAPSITKVVEFAKQVHGFDTLEMEDRVVLLRTCCIEIMCLRAACRYDPQDGSLILSNGVRLYRDQLKDMANNGVAMMVAPVFEFAHSISRLKLDRTEVAMLASVLLMQADRTGLEDPAAVERIQDTILGAFKRYVCGHHGHSLVRWATLLMKVTDLRSISTRHSERILAVRLDSDIPPILLEMFDEGENLPLLSSSFGSTPSLRSEGMSSEMSSLISPFHSPYIPTLFSPLSLTQLPSLSELHAIQSPHLRTPGLLTTATSPFWATFPNSLPSLPATPRTPTVFNLDKANHSRLDSNLDSLFVQRKLSGTSPLISPLAKVSRLSNETIEGKTIYSEIGSVFSVVSPGEEKVSKGDHRKGSISSIMSLELGEKLQDNQKSDNAGTENKAVN